MNIDKTALLEKLEALPDEFSPVALLSQLKEAAIEKRTGDSSEVTAENTEESSAGVANLRNVLIEKLMMLSEEASPKEILAQIADSTDFSWKEQVLVLIQQQLGIDLITAQEEDSQTSEEPSLQQQIANDWRTFRWEDGDLADRLEATAKEIVGTLDTTKAKALLEKFTAQL